MAIFGCFRTNMGLFLIEYEGSVPETCTKSLGILGEAFQVVFWPQDGFFQAWKGMERYVGIGWLGQLGWPRFVGRLTGLVGSNLLETHKISVFLIKKTIMTRTIQAKIRQSSPNCCTSGFPKVLSPLGDFLLSIEGKKWPKIGQIR